MYVKYEKNVIFEFLIDKKRTQFMKKIIVVLILLSISSVAFSQNNNIKKAMDLMQKGNYREASSIWDEILIKEPRNGVVLYNAALCELYTARPDLAMRYLKRFLDYNKPDADVYNLLGLSFERLGDIDSAIISFSNAIKLDKNYYEAYFNRGRCYVSQKKISEAKADFNYSKRNKTISPDLYFASGNLNYDLRFYDSAIIDFRKIEKYKNDDVHFLTLFANSFFLTSRFDSAIKYYTKILEIEPENVTVLNNRAVCYGELEMRDEEAADREKIEAVKTKVEINPNELEYRTLVPADSAFSIDIPTQWRIFAREDSVAKISEVVFFNPDFQNSIENGIPQYDFGGSIIYYSQYFMPDENLIATLNMREQKVIEHQENRKTERNETLIGFRERMKKTFNPNDKNARELIKATFFDVNPPHEKYFSIEYFIMTTTGKLICLYLWMPEESSFQYESIMDRIQTSLVINE